ncbi:hypothetical protein SAMN04488094_1203 [Tropicimonas isoalkanivorans]|uniref:Uncharacterized protein n=1 Tax=Tropicimonas isoalkanivorans TaxID=441112 RepID=A0A1I1QL44_9RHOB|nr:hypothetical protein SAMN04488094_1203 [Tropicimonas isoalkanivorans]
MDESSIQVAEIRSVMLHAINLANRGSHDLWPRLSSRRTLHLSLPVTEPVHY